MPCHSHLPALLCLLLLLCSNSLSLLSFLPLHFSSHHSPSFCHPSLIYLIFIFISHPCLIPYSYSTHLIDKQGQPPDNGATTISPCSGIPLHRSYRRRHCLSSWTQVRLHYQELVLCPSILHLPHKRKQHHLHALCSPESHSRSAARRQPHGLCWRQNRIFPLYL